MSTNIREFADRQGRERIDLINQLSDAAPSKLKLFVIHFAPFTLSELLCRPDILHSQDLDSEGLQILGFTNFDQLCELIPELEQAWGSQIKIGWKEIGGGKGLRFQFQDNSL